MHYEGYHTEEETSKCQGCVFAGISVCNRPFGFPHGCSDNKYIWVKDNNCQKVTVSYTIDMEAIKQDIFDYIASMDFTKYINRGT